MRKHIPDDDEMNEALSVPPARPTYRKGKFTPADIAELIIPERNPGQCEEFRVALRDILDGDDFPRINNLLRQIMHDKELTSAEFE